MKSQFLSSTISDDYVEKMKKVYTIDVNTLSSMDWLIVIGGLILTLITFAALIYWVYKLFFFLLRCRAGYEHFGDTKFWKRMGVSIIIIMLMMSGSLLIIFENLYTILEVWGWTTS